MSNRGKELLYTRGNIQKSITEILHDPRVQNFVGGKTYSSKRKLL